MTINELLDRFHAIATNPAAQKDAYLASGKKVVLVAPIYTPEEIIHSMDMLLNEMFSTNFLQKTRACLKKKRCTNMV
jgi:benzoyl-CoA reductase/2-hydroxyglutaryl-CoA dehydratase subunit BcrC/BadD/HgdB